jgi:hypothetical protein
MAAYYKVEVSLNTNSVTVGSPSAQEVLVTLPLVGPQGATGATGATGQAELPLGMKSRASPQLSRRLLTSTSQIKSTPMQLLSRSPETAAYRSEFIFTMGQTTAGLFTKARPLATTSGGIAIWISGI